MKSLSPGGIPSPFAEARLSPQSPKDPATASAGLRGFTLVELLTTVAIIGGLAALIFASSQNVRKMGARAATLSNMRQIGLGIQQYTADNNGRLPGPLTVSVFSWADYPTENTICSLGRFIVPYLDTPYHTPWLSYATRVYLPALNCPALSIAAQKSEVAQFVKLDYPTTSEDNIFGGPPAPSGLAFSSRDTVSPGPKTLAALTPKARNSAILTTADQVLLGNNTLLPATGVFNGKRLFLFLDGSVVGPVAQNGIWTR